MESPTPSYLEQLNRDGFVLVPNLLTPGELETLRSASQAVTANARAGNWPHVRTLPKQFPPWTTADDGESNPARQGIWGVQFLMHPAQTCQAAFVRSYFAPRLLDTVKQLLQCADDDLVMELYNVLVRPDADFALRWHRDGIAATATDDEELHRLRAPAWHAQWNVALYDDASLVVVPGSHRRARTATERQADPFDDHLPGQLTVRVRAGDAVFYNNNILHRGVYDANTDRLTLHGSMGHVKGSALRARNVLQHGVRDWVGDVDLSVLPTEEERVRAEGMRDRLVKMGLESGDVGYSLTE
ncbi:phytanoyl-CoA dioxygenase [Phlyctema vagabunda]|uniref:Phytanoyl-CoA dioxygenase n=1 Tax=Phlyctema vagabunda TaxID=108571 RepID=A0ABR4PC23_9HELO